MIKLYRKIEKELVLSLAEHMTHISIGTFIISDLIVFIIIPNEQNTF